MMEGPLSGIVCATLTPFVGPSLEVDKVSLFNLVDYLIENNVNTLFPVGTNGEGINMRLEMRCEVAKLFLEAAKGRVPVVIHTGALTTQETIELTLHAKKMGALAAGILVPFFYPIDPIAIERHYAKVAEEVRGFPLYLYNLPALTGQIIPFDTIRSLLRSYTNFKGLKLSTTDFLSFYRYIEELPDFPIFIGCDQMILSALRAGGKGTVSGGANCFPALYSSLYSAFQKEDNRTALEKQTLIGKISRLTFRFPEYAAYKSILKRMKIFRSDTMIPPLRPLTPEEEETLHQELDSILGRK